MEHSTLVDGYEIVPAAWSTLYMAVGVEGFLHDQAE
jgi:hypothetical protein